MHFRTTIDLLRVHQWVKNAFVFAALVFARRLDDPQAIVRAVAAFAIFCALASAVYIVNDIHDRREDARHPVKQHRPIAAGRIAVRIAAAIAAALGVVAVVLAFRLGIGFGAIAVGYVLLNITYSFWWKRIPLVDVMAVAANYVIRVLAGAAVIGAAITPWLLIASTLLALFLALGKRRHELVLLGDHAIEHRAALGAYSPYFLDQLIGIVTASTVVIYSLYTMDPQSHRTLGTPWLPLTIPIVLFGIFRYLYLIHQKSAGGNPTAVLLTDRPLLATVVIWLAAIVALVYVA